MSSFAELDLRCTGANDDSLAIYHQALQEFNCYIDDPLLTTDRALANSPDFVMAHVLHAYLHLLGTEPATLAIANSSRERAQRIAGNERERAHTAAVAYLVEGRWRQAGRVLEDISAAYPVDILALQAGHLVDFYTGNSRMLRDRIARALPAWSAAMPGYHSVLSMYAFGLEETGDYTKAETLGREAVARNARDGWGQHAVAHVLEMQGRAGEGVQWMRENVAGWATGSFFQVHNWWHLALFYLDQEAIAEVLKLFDQPIYGQPSNLILDMVDASALLWRLNLLQIDVGTRWQSVADNWQPVSTAGNYAFNDVHAAMALACSNRMDAIGGIIDTQKEVMASASDNAIFVRDVGQPLTLAIVAFAEGDYARVIELVRPVREIAQRFGGSHAQRDVIDLTLVEAAIRGGEQSLARALVNERLAIKPHSAANQTLMGRVNGMGRMAVAGRMVGGNS